MEFDLSTKFRLGFENFCDNTALHGFAQLYKARQTRWKVFWCIACGVACIASVYHVYISVYEYTNKPTDTTIASVNENEIYYPSVRLCYLHWYQWVDLDKVKKLCINKTVLLYSVSFFNDVFYEHDFDLNSAKKQFEDTMVSMNFTDVTQFYATIARPVRIKDTNLRNISAYFQNNEIIYDTKTNSSIFCYKLHGSNVFQYFKKYFSEPQQKKIISFNTLDESFDHVRHVLTETEYNHYIIRWVEKGGKYKFEESKQLNLTKIAPPPSLLLFKDLDRRLEMDMENDVYLVNMFTFVYVWLSKSDRKCLQEKQTLRADLSCQRTCNAMAASHHCNCLYLAQALRLNKSVATTENLCQNQINVVTGPDQNISQVTPSDKQQTCRNEFLADRSECMEQCPEMCKVWKYDMGVSVRSTSNNLKRYARKDTVEVVIEYPRGNEIVIMTEVDAQTWEMFIGNVGGILGIWTGASILSLVQLFYLCCIADRDRSAPDSVA